MVRVAVVTVGDVVATAVSDDEMIGTGRGVSVAARVAR